MTVRRSIRKGGFTLVEILIVVIILGILAAIVIPQFTSASQDARKNSLSSQLQTLRSQIELYKLQHLDQLPVNLYNAGAVGTVSAGTTLADASGAWYQMVNKTNAAGAVDLTGTSTAHPFGPYLQTEPSNPLNGGKGVAVVLTDVNGGAAFTASTNEGFILNANNGKIWGTSKAAGHVYDESNPSNPLNDE
jgi:general secretion pathway protein G